MDFFNIIQVCLFFYIIGKEIIERSGLGWDTEEDEQLTRLYSKYKMELTEIAKIHKRSVPVIEKRLERLKINPDISFNLDTIFFIVNNITFGINKRETIMNNLCDLFQRQFDIPREVLDKKMEKYFTIKCN
jgi:hypothetical protein